MSQSTGPAPGPARVDRVEQLDGRRRCAGPRAGGGVTSGPTREHRVGPRLARRAAGPRPPSQNAPTSATTPTSAANPTVRCAGRVFTDEQPRRPRQRPVLGGHPVERGAEADQQVGGREHAAASGSCGGSVDQQRVPGRRTPRPAYVVRTGAPSRPASSATASAAPTARRRRRPTARAAWRAGSSSSAASTSAGDGAGGSASASRSAAAGPSSGTAAPRTSTGMPTYTGPRGVRHARTRRRGPPPRRRPAGSSAGRPPSPAARTARPGRGISCRTPRGPSVPRSGGRHLGGDQQHRASRSPPPRRTPRPRSRRRGRSW